MTRPPSEPWGDPGRDDVPDPMHDLITEHEHGGGRLPRVPSAGSPDFLDLRPLHSDDYARPQRRRWRATVAALRSWLAVVSAWWRSDPVRHYRGQFRYRARQAPRDLGRLAWFALRGHGRWIAKAWNFFTYSDLRADARTARAAGDPVARREAQELLRADSRARWARAETAMHTGGRVVAAVLGVALLLWLVDALFRRDEMWPWLADLYATVDAVGRLIATAGPVLLVLAGVGWLVAVAYEGRDRSPGAGWLVRPDRQDADSWIDERMISQALAHLGIGPLDRFFSGGGELVYTIPARLDGAGTAAQVRLPMGVTADMVADRRARLAANLGRAKLETWPTEGHEAGVLDLWVADKGILGRSAGPWPLLNDGEVDIFDGVPFGQSQRGQILTAPMLERTYLIGGRPGQGKSSAGRTLALGCALDPTVELRVCVFAANPDFDPFTPRLSRYVKGDDEDAIEAGLAELRELRDEVTARGQLLERHGAAKVTRRLATSVPGLRPKVVIFDECHELFEHSKYGGEAGSLAIKVVKKARKTGIVLLFLTQSPTATSIPKDLTRNCSNGVAFSVADNVANDGLLGTGKYRAGIRATELCPGDDRGTAVATGLTANAFELVNTYYIAYDEDRDDVTPVITRAMSLLTQHGRDVPGQVVEPSELEMEVDHLADIHAAMLGERRVRTQVVLQRLTEHSPEVYSGWTFSDLTGALGRCGLGPAKSHGVMVIRADDLNLALLRRDGDPFG